MLEKFGTKPSDPSGELRDDMASRISSLSCLSNPRSGVESLRQFELQVDESIYSEIDNWIRAAFEILTRE